MNCSSLGLKLSKALLGFLQYKTAEGLSPNTLISYEHLLNLWVLQIGGDAEVSKITTQDLCNHIAWLRTEYKPRRFSASKHPLTAKSVRNAWVALCSFFTWASREFKFENPMKAVPAPRFEDPPIEPMTKEQIEALLKASEFSREANTDRRKKFSKRRETAKRDRAIILFLRYRVESFRILLSDHRRCRTKNGSRASQTWERGRCQGWQRARRLPGQVHSERITMPVSPKWMSPKRIAARVQPITGIYDFNRCAASVSSRANSASDGRLVIEGILSSTALGSDVVKPAIRSFTSSRASGA